MHPSVKEEDIAKSRGAFLLLKKILSDLDTQPPGLTGKVLTAWKGQREKEMIYLARVLRTVKSRDVRRSSLQKVRLAIEKETKELTELQVSSLSAADKDIKAQEIIGHITSTIGYLEFVMTHPKLVTGLGAAVWNKTAVKVAKKLFNKTLSRLDAIESGRIAKTLAPMMVKMPGADHIAAEFLKSRISWRPDLQERRAAELGFDLFGEIPKDIDLRVARTWMEEGLEKATAFLAKYVGPAMVFMDLVTVTLDTIDEVDRWASTLFKSGVTAWAMVGTGIVLDEIVATSGAIAATGAELSLMEAAIAQALLTLNTSLGCGSNERGPTSRGLRAGHRRCHCRRRHCRCRGRPADRGFFRTPTHTGGVTRAVLRADECPTIANPIRTNCGCMTTLTLIQTQHRKLPMGLIGTPILEVADAALAALDLGIEKKSKAETWKELASQAKRAMASTDQAARMEVNEYKEEYGSGVSTLLRIYNASGCTLRFEGAKHDSGRWDKYQPDGEIQNGQWSVCLHVKTSGSATGSCAAMKYKVMTDKWGIKEEHNLIIGWETPYSGFNSGLATVVGEMDKSMFSQSMSDDWAESFAWKNIHDNANNDIDNQKWMTYGAEALGRAIPDGPKLIANVHLRDRADGRLRTSRKHGRGIDKGDAAFHLTGAGAVGALWRADA